MDELTDFNVGEEQAQLKVLLVPGGLLSVCGDLKLVLYTLCGDQHTGVWLCNDPLPWYGSCDFTS